MVGTHAPAIRTSQVLSPAGKTITPSLLAGKTVVLDFWATWCGPCVAAMPHMNDLESSLDPSKFVFIALDDEDSTTVEKFLTKRKVSAIVALDRRGQTFRAYHVTSRPATIVIDPQGEVALVTNPQDLQRQTLVDISTGARKQHDSTAYRASRIPSVARQAVQNRRAPVMEAEAHPHEEDQDGVLAMVILRRKRPDEPDHSTQHSEDGRVAYIGFEAKTYLQMALHVSDKYITYRDDLPKGTFDLIMKPSLPDGPKADSLMLSFLQQGFGLDISETAKSEEVLVLTTSPSVQFKGLESVNQAAVSSVQQHGTEIAFGNLSTRNIADVIEARTGLHVVDETHIAGKYDGVLHWSGAVDEIKNAALNDLGLIVEHGRRDVLYYAVSKHKEMDDQVKVRE